jgi:uncharacterized protein DUF4349/PKD domain-containing protein
VNQLGGITKKRAVLGVAALIVVGGFVLALLSNSGAGTFGPSDSAASLSNQNGSIQNAQNGFGTSANPSSGYGDTQIISSSSTVTFTASTTTSSPPQTLQVGLAGNSTVTQGTPANGGGLIEFATNLAIRTSSPEQTASAVSALAYSVGGYVAYQSTYSDSAYVVIRVPSALYQQVLNQVKAMGTFLSETSNSNDVSVQYTDMNATLASLRTEQGQLLRLLNQTTTINSTLSVESQLQQVNQQINEVESQILQTRTLIDYATLNITVTQNAQETPLSLTMSATPTNGTSPLSVTFNAIVKGGAQPYVVNYNFGDGSATQGQIVIHTYYTPGNYDVLVSVTDQNGTVAQKTTVVKVVAPPETQTGVGGFFGYVGGLFVSVIEGIVEVAVVVLPLAAVAAAVVFPFYRRANRPQKSVKQSQ